MKRIKTKLKDIITYENIVNAYFDSLKNKKNRAETFVVDLTLSTVLNSIYDELSSGTYEVSPYCTFYIVEPKARTILQPRFKDLIVQRVIYNAIYDEVDKRLFFHTYGVRKKRGMHICSRMAQKYIREDTYYLQMDISKFFKSIDKEVFREILFRYFKDKDLIELMLKFFSADDGVPIGNLLSGIFGLLYLTPLDKFIKEKLQVKHYLRFMDDFVLFNLTIEEAKRFRDEITRYLDEHLKLSLSKRLIQSSNKGLNFIGFRTYSHKRILRKRTIKNFKNGNIDTRISILGMTLGTYSERLLRRKFNLPKELSLLKKTEE